jgi:hypothetical protein
MDELVNNDSDPFKLKSGGLLTLDGARKAAAHVAAEDGLGEEEKIVGTVFSKETRIRDEDEEMKKFIESEVEKRRGKLEEKTDQGQVKKPPCYLFQMIQPLNGHTIFKSHCPYCYLILYSDHSSILFQYSKFPNRF